MEWHQVEKRIGKRRQVRSIPMAWIRDPSKPVPLGAEADPDGRIVELSVTGAGMVALTHPNLGVGNSVMIAALGMVGTVIVRRIDQDIYPGESYYGIEFADANAALTRSLQRSFLAKATSAPSQYLPRG